MSTRFPPQPVRTPVALQTWSCFTALHWRFDPAVLQGRLPDGLRVQTLDDTAWVSLTPFLMEDVRPPLLPALPRLSTFPETNLRTYVVDEAGRDGIWFFALEAACLGLVVAARSAYRIPYNWASMSVEQHGGLVEYRSRRRWPGPGTARSSLSVELGAPIPAEQLSPLDIELTHRWRGFAPTPVGLAFTPVEHEPWPLWRATVRHLDESLLASAQLPVPSTEPLVHYSPGVHVRLGPPRLVR